MTQEIKVKVNGKLHVVNVRPYDTLSRVLRDEVGLTGTKRGCDYGGCGACTVSVDGRPVYSCMYPAQYCVGKEVTTVEGLSGEGNTTKESLSILQKSFLMNGGLQCGYCTNGILMSADRLLASNLAPTVAEVKEALAGNICRCTGYSRIIDSVMKAASEMRDAGNGTG
jgi:carbon-monoxide dehydrogenase small subunit